MKLFLAVALLVGAAQGAYWNYLSEETDSDEHGLQPGQKGTTCACGWTNKARVVGGRETLVNEYPLIAAIVNKQKRFVFCGGSIITNRHILTASHCTEPMKGQPLAVMVGAHNLYKRVSDNDQTTMIDVARTIEHENYNNRNFDNDIALLVLAKPIAFNQYIGPVCLPKDNSLKIMNEFIKVLGWGKLVNGGPSSRVLMKVDLRVIPLSDCVSRHSLFIDTVNPRQICTFRRNKDSCQGDSGGPLIKLDPETNRYTQVALVSYGLDCASMDPAVNTDVAFHMPWIRKKVAESGGDQICTKV